MLDGWREEEGSEVAEHEKKTTTYCCRRANSSCQVLTHCGSTGPSPAWRTNKATSSQNTLADTASRIVSVNSGRVEQEHSPCAPSQGEE